MESQTARGISGDDPVRRGFCLGGRCFGRNGKRIQNLGFESAIVGTP